MLASADLIVLLLIKNFTGDQEVRRLGGIRGEKGSVLSRFQQRYLLASCSPDLL